MVGRAGPTMVWSSAPRNSPSMTANRISSFSRCVRPRAGSTSSVGANPPSTGGNACRSRSISPLWLVAVVGAGAGIHDRLRDGHPKVGHGRRDADELRLVETIEHPL